MGRGFQGDTGGGGGRVGGGGCGAAAAASVPGGFKAAFMFLMASLRNEHCEDTAMCGSPHTQHLGLRGVGHSLYKCDPEQILHLGDFAGHDFKRCV